MLMQAFDPYDWYWIVGDDQSRAWSSRKMAYVSQWPANRVTRIASEEDLDIVLRQHGLRGPVVIPDDVRAEAARRMSLLVGARDDRHLDIIISNGLREAARLLRKEVEDEGLTAVEQARKRQLQQIDVMLEAIRAASNRLEVMEPVPVDYADDRHWPPLPGGDA